MDVSTNLKKLRNQYGFLQKQVAEAIGIHASNYNKIEKGERQLTVDMLIKIAALYECSIEEILYLDELKNPKELTVKEKGLIEKLRLIEELEEKDQEAIFRVIDTMLAKKKFKAIIDKNANL